MTDTRKRAEPDDPMALVCVAMPGGPEGEAAFAEMAEALAEEFFRIGYSKARVLKMFRTPFYRMTHAIWRAWGEERVRTLVETIAQRYEDPSPTTRARRLESRANTEMHDVPGS